MGLTKFSQTRISHQVAYALAEFGFCDTNYLLGKPIFLSKTFVVEIEKKN